MAELKTAFVGKSPRIAIEYMGAGPLLVFLHGVGGNRTNWREQLPVFADHFTTVAWDARGWGDSEDYDGPYQFSDVVEDLMGVYEFFWGGESSSGRPVHGRAHLPGNLEKAA